MNESVDICFVAFDELVELLSRVFTSHGTSDVVASVLANNCVSAERDGAKAHGLFRVDGYVSTLRSGWVNGRAIPAMESRSKALLRVDACNGFAQPALAAARPFAIAKAKEQGVALVAIRNSHHLGALWLDVEPFAHEGLLAFTTVNGISRVMPFGGNRAVYGTNPMALAAPRPNGHPLVFDQASSAMSYGELQLAADEGRTVPAGVGVDVSGMPTTDPKAILDGGGFLPFGGYKGSSIAMLVELLSAAATGGLFSFEIDRSAYEGAETSRAGQFILLLDGKRTGGDEFAQRVDVLSARLRASGQHRLPGDRRFERRREAELKGIAVERTVLERIRRLVG